MRNVTSRIERLVTITNARWQALLSQFSPLMAMLMDSGEAMLVIDVTELALVTVPHTAEAPHTALKPCVLLVPHTADVPHTALVPHTAEFVFTT